MRPETKELLLKYDEDQAWEFPSNFDANDIERRARKVHCDLCKTLGELFFEDWVHNQDASFGLAIILKPFELADRTAVRQPVIHFSNFGNLATFTWVELLPENAGKLIEDSLAKHGFTYVDADELDAAYDGVMSPNESIPTWWDRYFDWL